MITSITIITNTLVIIVITTPFDTIIAIITNRFVKIEIIVIIGSRDCNYYNYY